MRKNKKYIRKELVKAGGLTSLIIIGAIAGMLYLTSVDSVVENRVIEDHRTWHLVTADGDPGAGASGLLYFGTYPHQADPGAVYNSNLSSVAFYEYIEATNGELLGETPHSTEFDFVMKFRVNVTHGYNVSGSTWESSWVRANITVDFDFAVDISDVGMTIVEIATSDEYAWYHAYVNNGGSGYEITHNEGFSVDSLKLEAWY